MPAGAHGLCHWQGCGWPRSGPCLPADGHGSGWLQCLLLGHLRMIALNPAALRAEIVKPQVFVGAAPWPGQLSADRVGAAWMGRPNVLFSAALMEPQEHSAVCCKPSVTFWRGHVIAYDSLSCLVAALGAGGWSTSLCMWEGLSGSPLMLCGESPGSGQMEGPRQQGPQHRSPVEVLPREVASGTEDRSDQGQPRVVLQEQLITCTSQTCRGSAARVTSLAGPRPEVAWSRSADVLCTEAGHWACRLRKQQ